jgi:hypothetical protein
LQFCCVEPPIAAFYIFPAHKTKRVPTNIGPIKAAIEKPNKQYGEISALQGKAGLERIFCRKKRCMPILVTLLDIRLS